MAVFSAFLGKGDGREGGRWRESGRQTSSPGSIENADVEPEDSRGLGTRGSFCLHEGAVDLFRWVLGTSKNAQPVCQGLCTKPGAQHMVGTLTCLISWNVPDGVFYHRAASRGCSVPS